MGPDEDIKLAQDFNAANPHYGRFGEGTKTWPGEQLEETAAGRTWGWYSYDPELNLFYYSTGNPGTWNPSVSAGRQQVVDDASSRAIPTPGMAKWAYQMTPWDAWDYDGINEHVLVDLTIGGKATKALVHFDRNGFAYMLDRTNGTLLVGREVRASDQLGQRHRPEDGPARSRIRAKRTEAGRRHQGHLSRRRWEARISSPSAYSPRTKLIYAGTNNLCMNYEGVEVQYIAGAPYVGANVRIFPGPRRLQGEFMAWDPAPARRSGASRNRIPCGAARS